MTTKDKQEAERIAGELVTAHRIFNGKLDSNSMETMKLAKAIELFGAKVATALSTEDEAHITFLDSL